MTIGIIYDTSCPTCGRQVGERCVVLHRDGAPPTVRQLPHEARRLRFKIERASRPAS